jgi:hypothetical protein
VAREPAENYVVAWQQQSAAAGGWDVWAQQFALAPSGGNVAALHPAFQVSGPSGAWCRQLPAVATDALGDFVVAWQSNEDPSGNTGIYAQVYDSSGQALLAQQLHVNTTTSFNDQAPAVAMAADGRFLVVWQRDGNWDGSSLGIVARLFALNGSPETAEIAVNRPSAGAQHSPAAAWLPAAAGTPERFAIAWQSEGQDGAGPGVSGIVGRLLDGAGNPLGGELAINAPATGAHAHPRLASDPSGNFLVAWENLTAAGSAVVARRFNAAGTALSDQTLVDAAPTGAEHDPVVAVNDVGELVVAFDTLNQDGSGTAVVAQLFDNLGPLHALGGKVQLNTTTDGDQASAGIGLSAGGNLLLAWQDQTAAADAAVVTARAATLPPLAFFTVVPCRLLDTRNATGPLGGPALASGQARNFPLQSASCQIPPTAKALSINATAVSPSANGSLVAYPGDAAPSGTSNLDFGTVTVTGSVHCGVSSTYTVNLISCPTCPSCPPGFGPSGCTQTTPVPLDLAGNAGCPTPPPEFCSEGGGGAGGGSGGGLGGDSGGGAMGRGGTGGAMALTGSKGNGPDSGAAGTTGGGQCQSCKALGSSAGDGAGDGGSGCGFSVGGGGSSCLFKAAGAHPALRRGRRRRHRLPGLDRRDREPLERRARPLLVPRLGRAHRHGPRREPRLAADPLRQLP